MKLFHTSPNPITHVTENGLFGPFLCFASKPYIMTAATAPVVYTLELDESEVIDAAGLFYHDDAAKLQVFVEEVMELLGCDEDEAERQLEQRADFCGDADISWRIQHLTALCASALGYCAVKMQDEQGALWLVNMLGREHDLQNN